jgi:hypothetical protein
VGAYAQEREVMGFHSFGLGYCDVPLVNPWEEVAAIAEARKRVFIKRSLRRRGFDVTINSLSTAVLLWLTTVPAPASRRVYLP